MEQRIIGATNNYAELDGWIWCAGAKKVLLVCDGAILHMTALNRHLEELSSKGIELVRFCDFVPNPKYESILEGLRVFESRLCDAIIAVGGGSAIDVAKCIKAFVTIDGGGPDGSYLRQEIVLNAIPFLAMPTTAGTGSEATRYAVVYYNGEKQSVTSESLIPDTVLMDPGALSTLPPYQRKATMMDALCHAVESCWSVNSTAESRAHSREAIRGVMRHMRGYLNNTAEGNAGMLMAAHVAGKAINIAQTTAGHAMCYKITSLFRIAHGHAAALCVRKLYPWMVENTGRCTDLRGEEYLTRVLDEIGVAMGCGGASDGAAMLEDVFCNLKLEVPKASAEQFGILKSSVNPVRLRNHPIELDTETIDGLYHKILREAC